MTVILLEHLASRVCNIVINRPAKRNALNLETLGALRDVLQKFDQDDRYDVAIVSGAGGCFCAGYDLNEMVNVETGMPNIQQIERMLWPLGNRLTSRKITIAAIEGHAAGLGLELALKCDFRVADRTARLGFLNRRFGIPTLNGGTVLLPKLIGRARAIELITTGKAQLAPDALQHGLLTLTTDVGCSLGQSLSLARSLCKFNQSSLLHDLKQLTDSDLSREIQSMEQERVKSMEFLQNCGPLGMAIKFLRSELGRHGSMNMGNLAEPIPEVTL